MPPLAKGKLILVSMEEYKTHICTQHHNYIDNCIKEFTTLTPEEEANLQRILKGNKNVLEVTPIECVESGKRYKNIYVLAKALGKSVKTVETYIKFKTSYLGRHFEYIR